MFELEFVRDNDSRLLSRFPANTLLGPMTMGVVLLILPKLDRSPALGGGLGTEPPAVTQPSGPDSALRSPPRLDPPLDMLS